jgi:uncharacterized YkwD family protein
MIRKLTTKKPIILFLCLLVTTVFLFSLNSHAQSYVFKWSPIKQIEVTAYSLNIRTGPSTAYRVIGFLQQGDVVDVLGTLSDWYVIHTDNDMVGLISSKYTRVYAYHDSADDTTEDSPADNYSYELTEAESEMIRLINEERIKLGLLPYEIDMALMRVARIKAADLVANNYFSHNSPVYGSPFEMLSSFMISYTTAGENIAGNSTLNKAHDALMNSPSHKANILNDNFTNIGVAIVDDGRYGKIVVQMFIE